MGFQILEVSGVEGVVQIGKIIRLFSCFTEIFFYM